MPFTKTRTRDGSAGWSQATTYTRTVVNTLGVKTVTSYPVTVTTTSMKPDWVYTKLDWNVYPGYKAFLQTNGYLPTLEFQRTKKAIRAGSPTPVVWRRKDGVQEWYEVPHTYCAPLFPSNWPSWDDPALRSQLVSQAQNDCLSRARDMRVNLPVMLAEGRQTVRMLRDTATTLYRSYRAFRRGRFRKVAEILGIDKPSGTAANHWLSYQYGWRPLLSDAKGLVVMAAQLLEAPRAKLVRVSGKAVKEQHLSYTGNSSTSPLGRTLKAHLTGKVITEAYAGLVLELQFRPSAVAAQLGMGVADPLLVAWEVTPFSFVFDWFVDVGSYLENISALQGWSVKSGYTAWKNESKDVIISFSPNDPTYYIAGGRLPAGDVFQSDYYRQSWGGSAPGLVVRSFGDIWNTSRLSTTASLFRQRTMGDRNGSYRP